MRRSWLALALLQEVRSAARWSFQAFTLLRSRGAGDREQHIHHREVGPDRRQQGPPRRTAQANSKPKFYEIKVEIVSQRTALACTSAYMKEAPREETSLRPRLRP